VAAECKFLIDNFQWQCYKYLNNLFDTFDSEKLDSWLENSFKINSCNGDIAFRICFRASKMHSRNNLSVPGSIGLESYTLKPQISLPRRSDHGKSDRMEEKILKIACFASLWKKTSVILPHIAAHVYAELFYWFPLDQHSSVPASPYHYHISKATFY
jgi:hypothetical protein